MGALQVALLNGSYNDSMTTENFRRDVDADVNPFAVDRGVPVLGVCFGHQLVADVLGGEVEPMGEYELGYREVEVEPGASSVLLDGLADRFVAFSTHSDEVTALPPDTTVTASNDYSIQGFRRGDAFGVQFHPEYDRASAERVTRGKDLPEERVRHVLEGITDESVAAATDAKIVFDNFLEYARRRSET
ncbi:type 1 glutamine amidotransferase [Natronococcus sp.]|uniref:type 1 glutamine amidotransferase n=1 Tax=Natronococcus sp. TaxID=35747 RepID=UPI003A4DF045